MKRTATITFHASHNYGSMLQAYALQQTLLSLGVDNDIINFRSDRQLRQYSDPRSDDKSWKRKFFDFATGIFLPIKNGNIEKYDLFEKFLNEKLKMTEQFSTGDEIRERLGHYDYYITGSDQCWNTNCRDFDWAYYLDFTDSPNKISYASSMGPVNHNKDFDTVKKLLPDFKSISVRETGTADMVKGLIGREVEILPDPTLLLPSGKWKELFDNKPLIDYPYIFMYSPYYKKGFNEMAMRLSHSLNLPLVISNMTSKKEDLRLMMFKKNIKYVLNVGPCEFLNLIYNSRFVMCGSFHALVFSIIFHKPFFAYNGMTDNRMSSLLKLLGHEDRAICFPDYDYKIKEAMTPDFIECDKIIKTQRDRSLGFLKHALDL